MAETTTATARAHWNSRIGFVLAAAGSAVGLGNIWKFPYITGENGGGAFVLVYLACITFVGLPIMIAEIVLGRASQRSPVSAIRSLSPGSAWVGVGWLGVIASFCLLSYYGTVAGWSLHYCYLAFSGQIGGQGPEQLQAAFDSLLASPPLAVGWQTAFMALSILVVAAGVSRGVERWSRILMPTLGVMLLILLGKAFTLSGFGEGMDFLFGFRTDKLTAAGVLEALGHAFFTLSLGIGTMITYGSYLRKQDDMVAASVMTSAVDTLVALMASMMLFPIIFTFGLEPGQGPGLLFVTVPVALAQMSGGGLLAIVFFVLLAFAALTSAISMLEVVTAYLIDDRAVPRRKATVCGGVGIAALGVPAAVSTGWFGQIDYLVSNWMLPLGGLGAALYVAWRMDAALRRGAFESGSALVRFYTVWLAILKYPVPVAVALVFLHAVGVLLPLLDILKRAYLHAVGVL